MLIALLLQAAACPATPAAPPPDLAGWRSKALIAAAREPAALRVGQGARATLLPAAAVRLPAVPGKAAAAGTSSGVFRFIAAAPGRYRVALGATAWLDVVAGGRTLPSVGHAHGPACTGIRKIVDFDLCAGDHLLQIVGSPVAAVDVMVAKLP